MRVFVTKFVFGILALVVTGPVFAFQPAPTPLPPELPQTERVTSRVEIHTYEVTGRSEREIALSMRDNGPVGFDSETLYYVSPQFSYEETDTGCALVTLSVSIDIDITYPNWAGYRSSRSLRNAWRDRMNRLQAHENGHARLIVLGGAAIRDAVEQIDEKQLCDAYQREVRSAISSGLRDIQNRQRRYDRATNHGRQQDRVNWDEMLEGLPEL